MNILRYGTVATGAPGSIAREHAETKDQLRGVLYAIEMVMDDLKFHVQTGRFRPSESTVKTLTVLKDRFNEAKQRLDI